MKCGLNSTRTRKDEKKNRSSNCVVKKMKPMRHREPTSLSAKENERTNAISYWRKKILRRGV